MTRVISYTRFSSARQAKGDSYRRQTEMAMKWCRDNGHVLDTELTLEDLGVSGYSGANVKKGALAVLQEMLAMGQIEPGTILLIEAFDRLTRMNIMQAYGLIFGLINSGLVIVTVTDGKVWNSKTMNNLTDFMMSLVLLYRGHEESARKSDLLRKTFNRHRNTGSQQAFGVAPGWLYREEKSQVWVVIEELAESVRKVFEMSAQGYGSKAIAKRANEENWPIPTRKTKASSEHWHAQMPGQMLRNRSVLGEHEHRIRTHDAQQYHWKGLSTGMVIPDYYPQIVSDELWHRARASIDTRMVEKRRDTQYYNIWSGLMYCGLCGAPIQRRSDKNWHSKGQHFCSDKLAGVTACPSSSIVTTDFPLLCDIYSYASTELGTVSGEQYVARAAELEVFIKDKAREASRLTIAIAKTNSSIEVLSRKLLEVEEAMRHAQDELREVQQEAAICDGNATFDESFIEDVFTFLYVPDSLEAKDKRAALHLKLCRLIDHIFLYPYDAAAVKWKNQNVLMWVKLNDKQLPSRSDPTAKFHKPPKPRPPKPHPYYEAGMRFELVPPEPKIRAPFKRREKSYRESVVPDDVLDSLDNIEDGTS